ncbi:MAG: hypothetical protein NC336_02330 [Clostridium sp.]|nr:hypothetical protein [Clostridium sp.]
MNTENFDIEQLRKAWIEMGKALGMQAAPDNNPADLDRKRTALDRLRDRYLAFWIISSVMAVAGFLIFSNGLFVASRLNFWLRMAYAVYFLTVASMDFWLWRGIGSIDPLRMNISEISRESMYYRKRHLQFMAALIPMAIMLLCFTGYLFASEMYFLYGMIVGVILGAIIGTRQFRRFMAEYRRLSD